MVYQKLLHEQKYKPGNSAVKITVDKNNQTLVNPEATYDEMTTNKTSVVNPHTNNKEFTPGRNINKNASNTNKIKRIILLYHNNFLK